MTGPRCPSNRSRTAVTKPSELTEAPEIIVETAAPFKASPVPIQQPEIDVEPKVEIEQSPLSSKSGKSLKLEASPPTPHQYNLRKRMRV